MSDGRDEESMLERDEIVEMKGNWDRKGESERMEQRRQWTEQV